MDTGTSTKVIVGISGGVDSSVAAHLLLEEGYAVEGLFMKNWEEDDGTEYCTALQDLADAQRACERLGIILHTANFAAEYWDDVFEEFLSEYRYGNTPNPDVLCNREIKFKQFADYARRLGAQYIATGHYARISGHAESVRIYKGSDAAKDQTYFLQAVPRQQLRNCLFPLGTWHKDDVRKLARDIGLHNAQRKDSTGICFIGERRFADFISAYVAPEPGPIWDTQQRCVGSHSGLHQFTVGQRQGINIGGRRSRPQAPWYVVAKNKLRNALIVSQDQSDLQGCWLRADQENWLHSPPLPWTGTAKIRYRQDDQPCRVVRAADGRLSVRFSTPQRAIAPGQYIAFYSGAELLGGARIARRPKHLLETI